MKTPTRPTLAEIDLGALSLNLQRVRQCVGPNVSIMAVVKANAYGHGLAQIAAHAAQTGAEYLGVAFPEEGVALREAGITKPVHVFALPSKSQCDLYFRHRLEPTVCSLEESRWLDEIGKKRRKSISVHVKIDTGMNRIGVRPKRLGDFIKGLTSLNRLNVKGVFTHFATADDEDKSFARRQLGEFHEALELLRKNGVNPECIHCANSAAIMTMPESHFSMVRPGIMLYGYSPSRGSNGAVPLSPVMSLKSRVSLVKEIDVGESVSYGRRFIASRRTRIATLPLGYADGFFRLLSGRSAALINGQRYPVVGTICMDQLMVDVGNSDVRIGDDAVLIGKQGAGKITAWELAERLGTIPYEICCAISARVPRSYSHA